MLVVKYRCAEVYVPCYWNGMKPLCSVHAVNKLFLNKERLSVSRRR